MKQIIIAMILCLVSSSIAQNTLKDLSNTKDIIWFGINFSEAKMIGAFDQGFGAGEASASSIKNKWIPSWNNLVLDEPKLFKVGDAFKKENVYYDIDANKKLNADIKTESLMSFNPYSFTNASETIKQIVSQLDAKEKQDGIGVVFIVESFNKTKEEAVVYVTLFDIKTKSILVSEKISSKPAGIGLRNFWAGAIKNLLKQIDKEYYHSWATKK